MKYPFLDEVGRRNFDTETLLNPDFAMPFLEQKIPIPKTDIDRWSEWNSSGWIPGPEEDERAFKERIEFCLHLRPEQIDLPLEFDRELSGKILAEALPLTEKLYGIRPDRILLLFGNHRLSPWHGGCAWIFQSEENSPTGAFIQLRNSFKTSPVYAGIYDRRELTVHELAHIGRMMYNEPRFEEFFAYRSSPSNIRRFFGPIVRSQNETFLFAALLAVAVSSDFASVFFTGESFETLAFWSKIFPLLLIGFGLFRLIRLRRVYEKCLLNLKGLYSGDLASRLLYRLTDSEIERFSDSSPEETAAFIRKSADRSFRWRFLHAIYPPNIKTPIK